MEKVDNSNDTEGPVRHDTVLAYASPPFPAWVPAVTVAISMVIFLAGSFYCRHRKVIKKRQILMDYFYVIFQYGGIRRKRMVAALCNTNSITLRELGRSFMLSFDSVANSDNNSCPFFLEDSPFPASRGPTPSPMMQKKSFFRNRGMTITRKYRGPFIRINTQTEENAQANGVSFQDIVMKFKSKRPHGNDASVKATPNRRHVPPPQYEGSSMCTIHGDDTDYRTCLEEKEVAANYNRERRNAYVVQCDPAYSKYTEVYGEVGRHSLGHVIPDQYRGQQTCYSGKRNSEPFQNLQGYIPGQSHCHDQQHYYFHAHGEQLSPSDVVCGSHGFISKSYEPDGCCQYRNSEPTILVHSPSTETDAPQGWSHIRSRNTNGIVFLKRVPKPDGAPGEFYYEEQKTPSPDLSRRVSLSKVSYVPAGNMNEYYNCLHSNVKDNTSKEARTTENKMSSQNPATPSQGSSKSKRSRLSLGDLAISNFNRRIDLGSDSLNDSLQEADQSSEHRGPQDSTRSSPKITWTKLKNVFTGSRAAQELQGQGKLLKSVSAKQVRQKRRNNRRSTSWQRFVSMFTGFRSLPETKKPSTSVDIPQSSSSYPLGLDINVASQEDPTASFDIESPMESRPAEHHRRIYELRYDFESSLSSRPSYKKIAPSDDDEVAPKVWDRPNALSLAVKTRSFPEELLHGRQYCHRTGFEASGKVPSPKNQASHYSARRYRNRNDRVVTSLISLPQANKDYSCYAFQAGYSPSPEEYRFRSPDSMGSNPGATSPTMEEYVDVSENSMDSHCFSERHTGSQEKTRPDNSNTDENLDSASDTSSYSTPNDNFSIHFQQDLYPEDTISISIANEISNHQDDKPNNNAHFTVKDSEHCSQRTNNWANSRIQYTSSGIKLKSAHKFKSNDSVFVNVGEDAQEKSAATTNNSVFDSKESLPHFCNLNIEHRHAGLSSESVYFDSVCDTSPCDNKDICSIGNSTLDRKQSPVNRIHTASHDTVGQLVLDSSVFLSEMASNSCLSEIPQIGKIQTALELRLIPLPNCDVDRAIRDGFKSTQALIRVQSTPVLSEDITWEQSTCIQTCLPKRWTSHPLNFKTPLDTSNGQSQSLVPYFKKDINPYSNAPMEHSPLKGQHNKTGPATDRNTLELSEYCRTKEQCLGNMPT
ncbi:unnamed protein product, partial [Candidula unifasciata]